MIEQSIIVPLKYLSHTNLNKNMSALYRFAEFIFNCKNKRMDPFNKKRLQACLDEIADHPEMQD